MPRYAFRLEYHGAPFQGWQRQDNGPSVQAAVEAALSRLEPEPVTITAAGRTDTGVHATGQVIHADLATARTPFRLMEALNHHLRPDPVAVTACALVDDTFHARFDAMERRYLYRILIRRAPPVMAGGQVWAHRAALDIDAMREGAAHLLGRHDFTTFRSAHCQANSPLRTLDAVEITEVSTPSGPELHLRLRARSFLHNQVRSIVGTLARVGTGAWAPERVAQALAARDRAACGPVAPPEGLCLTGVRYPHDPFENRPTPA